MQKQTHALAGILADLIACFISVVLSSATIPFVESWAQVAWPSPPLVAVAPVALLCFPFLTVLLALSDLYNVPRRWTPVQILRALTLAVGVGALLFLVASLLFPRALAPSRKTIVLAGVIVIALMLWLRCRWPELYGRPGHRHRALLVGAHTFAVRALLRFAREHADELEILGIIDDFKGPSYFENVDIHCFGTRDSLPHVIERYQIDTLVVLNDQAEYASTIIDQLDSQPQVQDVFVRAQIPLFMAQDIDIFFVHEVPLLKVFSRSEVGRVHLGREVFERAMALFGLIVSAPVFLILPILIRLESAGPVFYRQKRLGLHNQPFWIFKFRSMVADAEKSSGAVLASANDPRVTRMGRILRATRLDELPQLINVLKGEMSLIGPRPERPEFQDPYLEIIPWYPLRSKCKPGVTGLAQVSGDYDTSAQRKLLYDVSYLASMSPLLDLRILLATVVTVLTKRGH